MLLDPGTKGGALFLALIAFVVPIIFYEFVTNVFGFDGIEAGKWIGGGFTVIATLAWVGTYIFRVATKDMTYVRTYIYLFCVLMVQTNFLFGSAANATLLYASLYLLCLMACNSIITE